jgi:hypothetical protein
MLKRFALALFVVTALGGVAAPAVSAGAPPAQRTPAVLDDCTITIIGQRPSGELITTAPRCFGTQDEALRDSAAALQNVVAIHYKQTDYTGPSLTVNGNSCTGGYGRSTSAAWSATPARRRTTAASPPGGRLMGSRRPVERHLRGATRAAC